MGVLLTPFGKNAAYVAGVILIVILILIVWAFRQGREIGLWPPKIGLRPDRGKAACTDLTVRPGAAAATS